VSLNAELREVHSQLQQLHLQLQTSKKTALARDEEVEQLQCQITSYYNTIEVCFLARFKTNKFIVCKFYVKVCSMLLCFSVLKIDLIFLQKKREENQELQVVIDMMKMETQNMKKKGNSLFSEVWFNVL